MAESMAGSLAEQKATWKADSLVDCLAGKLVCYSVDWMVGKLGYLMVGLTADSKADYWADCSADSMADCWGCWMVEPMVEQLAHRKVASMAVLSG